MQLLANSLLDAPVGVSGHVCIADRMPLAGAVKAPVAADSMPPQTGNAEEAPH